jgi:hypothetical protein
MSVSPQVRPRIHATAVIADASGCSRCLRRMGLQCRIRTRYTHRTPSRGTRGSSAFNPSVRLHEQKGQAIPLGQQFSFLQSACASPSSSFRLLRSCYSLTSGEQGHEPVRVEVYIDHTNYMITWPRNRKVPNRAFVGRFLAGARIFAWRCRRFASAGRKESLT